MTTVLHDEDAYVFEINQVTASGRDSDDNNEKNAIDTDFESRWSVEGKNQFLTLEPKYEDNHSSINQIGIAFYKGDTRKQFFRVQESNDSENFIDVGGDRTSSGKTDGLELFKLDREIKSKFVRVMFNGNDDSANDWNSVYTLLLIHDPNPENEIPEDDDGGSGSGQKTKEGVELKYPSKDIKYKWKRNFRNDGKRFDFVGLGSKFKSSELTGYFRFEDNPVKDEVSGKMGGGRHSNNTKPCCFDIGVEVRTGDSRLRLEEKHHDMFGEKDGKKGKPLKDKYIGYRFVKKNTNDGIHLEFWQDTGNNEGDKPANDWGLVSEWECDKKPGERDENRDWRNPPTDHVETIRIDDPGKDELKDLEWKWISLSEIKED